MITYQDVRCNMSETGEGNKLGADITNGKAVSLQLECELSPKERDESYKCSPILYNYATFL